MIPALPANPKVEVTISGEVVSEFLINTTTDTPRWDRAGRINLYPNSKE